jgi:hypothetical protein
VVQYGVSKLPGGGLSSRHLPQEEATWEIRDERDGHGMVGCLSFLFYCLDLF